MYEKIIRKIDDVIELREELTAIFNTKSPKDMGRFGLLLGKHILDLTKTEPCIEITSAFDIINRWLEGKARFQEARQAAFILHRLAREEKDPIKVKVYRVIGQIAATPHVKKHVLIATDYAIKIINLKYPNNLEEVRREREVQIKLMKSL